MHVNHCAPQEELLEAVEARALDEMSLQMVERFLHLALAPGVIGSGAGGLDAEEAAELEKLRVPTKERAGGVQHEDLGVIHLRPLGQPVEGEQGPFNRRKHVTLVHASAGVKGLVAAIAQDCQVHVHPRDPLADQHSIFRPVVLRLFAWPGLVGLERLSALSIPLRLQFFVDPAVQRGLAPSPVPQTGVLREMGQFSAGINISLSIAIFGSQIFISAAPSA